MLQVTSHLSPTPSTRQALVQALSDLLTVLHTITARPGILDAKLAEYVFVPISQVLRISRQAPVRALELSLECISALLRAGWGEKLDPALSGQLIILFTFLAKPSSGQNGLSTTSEELQTLAIRCLKDLFTQVSRTSTGKSSLTADANIPALGEAVLVTLNNLTDSGSAQIKLEAVSAVISLNDAIEDDDALASFFPRIVSSLTKVLTPSGSHRTAFRVAERALQLYATLTVRLLSDESTKDLPIGEISKDAELVTGVSRSKSWLRATLAQYKIALANVFRLRDHDKVEVQRALLQLCLCIIQDCRTTLSECVGMAIDTMITLTGHESFQDAAEQEIKTLLIADRSLSDLLLESLHGWIMSLPRLMQSKDDPGRQRLIHQISVTLRLCCDKAYTLNDKLAINLRDAVSMIFADSRGLEEIHATHTSQESGGSALTLGSKINMTFAPLTLRFKGQESLMADFRRLMHELSRSESALPVAQDLRQSVETGPVEMRVGSFWMIVTLLQDVTTAHPTLDDFFDLGGPNPREELLDDIYSFSVSVLSRTDSGLSPPWQFSALALEVVAMQAKRYQSEFRAELSEVLYPVLDHLGSSNPTLRGHAMTCLNIIAVSSGYSNASELVVANVDYIVNAVSLKLAIGDVSPQAPQVLLMMMRLCGPSLLPYLDDLVDTIFETLERYHGYPKLAELLFAVLRGMTEEGVKSSELLAIEDASAPRKSVSTVADVVDALKKLQSNAAGKRDTEGDGDIHDTFPQEPWKRESLSQEEVQDQPEPPPPEKSGPPAPRVFDILLRISELTQHYLTTNSSILRNSLLGLLRTTIPALAKHEDSFLPLINTLWPVLLPRLHDSEAYIVSNSLDIISLMCEHAGEFMRTRIEDAWDSIMRVYKSTKQNHIRGPASKSGAADIATIVRGMNSITMETSKDSTAMSRPELYVDAPSRMIWNSLVNLFSAIARHVTLKEERFDEMLNVLEPVLGKQDVREALERSNADAVWLRMYKMALRRGEGGAGLKLAERRELGIGKVPVGMGKWRFVAV